MVFKKDPMYRFVTKCAKCKKCGSALVEKFEIIIPEYGYIPYDLFLKEHKGVMSKNWQVRPSGYACSKRGCTTVVTHRPQRKYSMNEIRKRLESVSYHVKEIELFRYQTNFFSKQSQQPEVPEHKETYSGVIYLDTPGLWVGSDPQFRMATLRVIESGFVQVAKTREDLYKDFNHWYLIHQKDLRGLKRREVTSVITL